MVGAVSSHVTCSLPVRGLHENTCISPLTRLRLFSTLLRYQIGSRSHGIVLCLNSNAGVHDDNLMVGVVFTRESGKMEPFIERTVVIWLGK